MSKSEKFVERTMESYIEGRIADARNDAVSFGEIVFSGRRLFNIADGDIEAFAREVLYALLQSGARTVRPIPASQGCGWELIPEYQLEDHRIVVQRLIENSNNFDKDNEFFAWFSFNWK